MTITHPQAEPTVAGGPLDGPRRPQRLLHLDLKTVYSYGDQLLFELVRQTFNSFGGGGYFDVTESHPYREPATEAWVDEVNANYDGVVIGGGGIFPRRLNAAPVSGWQWNIAPELLARLKKPVIVFGAGNPPDFDPRKHNKVFREHINQTMKQSIFFGLRSTGAVDAMRDYLEDPEDAPLVFQPCPTTIAKYLLPGQVSVDHPDERRLGLQLGLETPHLDSGLKPEDIFPRYVDLVQQLQADGWQIDFFAHKRTDFEFFVQHGERLGLNPVQLYGTPDVLFSGVHAYAQPSIVLGARGHSQMIPFGAGRIPLSLSTNQKIRFFAREAGHPEWLIDPWATDMADQALATVRQADENRVQLEADIAATQQRFLATTKDNLATIYERLTGDRVEADLVPYTDRELRLALAGYADDLERRDLREMVGTGEAENRARRGAATVLLRQAREAARNGDYGTARQLRGGAAALDAELVGGQPVPAWDSGIAHYVPGQVLSTVKRTRRIVRRYVPRGRP
jgi:hypothetical protein